MISSRNAFLPVRPLLVIAILCVSRPICADDVDDLDRQLLDALEGNRPADSPQQIVPRLIESTRTTAQKLREGQLDSETIALQEQILSDIDALLQQSPPPNAAPSSAPSQSDQQSQDPQALERQDPAAQGSQNRQNETGDSRAESKESQQRTTPGEESGVVRDRRLGLSTSAWGHLPPKVREQMRSAFSEDYLPEYDALVRRYYEALARRRSAEPNRPNLD